MSRWLVYLMKLTHSSCDVLCYRALVVRTHHNTRFVEVLIQGNLLWGEDVHYIAFLVEAHTFDGKQVGRIELAQCRRLAEHIIDNFVLHHFEGDDSSDQRESRLILLIERLHLEQRTERVLLLALVELFVKAELVLLFEDAVREAE